MAGVGIRSYKEVDLAACRSLWVELTAWHRGIYGSPSIGGDEPGLLFDEHLAAVGPENLWVADDAGIVVGLAGLVVGDSPELEPVVVTRDRRGEGIGRRLVEKVVAVCRETGLGTVSVRPVARNVEALAFFAALGFGVLGHIELMQDLRPGERPWRDGETFAGHRYQV